VDYALTVRQPAATAGWRNTNRRVSTVSATAGQADGVRSLADRLGIEADSVVMEIGYDDDVDEDLRDQLLEKVGEFVDEDTDEVVDVVLLWFREDDGDLVDAFFDILTDLKAGGVVWLLTPKVGRDGYVETSDIAEAAPVAGLATTSTLSVTDDWSATKLVVPKSGRRG
jgi:hypothetical protein